MIPSRINSIDARFYVSVYPSGPGSSTDNLEKLEVAQLVEKCSAFYETEV
jgi:hypothetical protein